MRYMSFSACFFAEKAHPDFCMVIQFTGGRAGGHHSFEDQFEPLLKTYVHMSHKNVILVVGGGLGDADSCWEFLSGQWSMQYDYPKMPCDGVLFGSRVMATKEAATCDQAKDLIVAASGVHDQKDWEKSYEAGLSLKGEIGRSIGKSTGPDHRISLGRVLATFRIF